MQKDDFSMDDDSFSIYDYETTITFTNEAEDGSTIIITGNGVADLNNNMTTGSTTSGITITSNSNSATTSNGSSIFGQGLSWSLSPSNNNQNVNMNMNTQSIIGNSTAISSITNQLTFVEKDDLQIIIVRSDGTCLEMKEQQSITPREMINISKFILAVNTHAIILDNTLKFSWLSLIKKLGIEKHFSEGKTDFRNYDENSSTFFVFLFEE